MTTTFGPEFLVNTTTAEGQDEPGVSVLADGRFVITWTDFSGTAGDTTDAAIRAQVFNADGSKAGAEILVNSTTKGRQSDPSVTLLADGGLVIAWADLSLSADDASGAAIRAQVFAADGSKAGAEFLVNTTTAGNQAILAITTLSDGNVVIGWRDSSVSGGDTSGDAIRAQIFDASGSKVGGEFLANTTTLGSQSRPEIAALADGRFVMTWTDERATVGDTSGSAVRGQVFNADGSKAGAEFLVNTTTLGQQNDATVAALAKGGFVVTWTDQSASVDETSGSGIRAQAYAADGSPVGAEFLVNTSTDQSQTDPAVTGLADGGFIIAWVDESKSSGDTSGTAIRAQVFKADGSASGQEFVVNTTTLFDQKQPQLTTLADGRVLVGWRDSSATGEDASGPAIRGQILDPRTKAVTLAGSDFNDSYFGTGFADRMSGGLANDSLHGAGGNDLLRGGDGLDSFSGGGGNDRIFGGLGTDSLTGAAGADDFIFASAVEAKGDRIGDFRHGVDDINLRGFMKGGEFIGGRAFTKDDDQVRYVKATGLLQGDVNGDGKADWSLVIANKAALSAEDFIF
ncbi:calcium-binding protein [Neogemmobacter tilapiae]|uniref:Calcium-binding protein n=1 Tax=Neogemmobacter tilapiae TaxID=875041 RepID=A0A918TUR5_9RHOB|nr:hypothetical protein [Gemmobacter tilapiae]GHC59793.1 hypothetical protein GCM10007315_24480 [Gemmobacter tilapiae]